MRATSDARVRKALPRTPTPQPSAPKNKERPRRDYIFRGARPIARQARRPKATRRKCPIAPPDYRDAHRRLCFPRRARQPLIYLPLYAQRYRAVAGDWSGSAGERSVPTAGGLGALYFGQKRRLDAVWRPLQSGRSRDCRAIHYRTRVQNHVLRRVFDREVQTKSLSGVRFFGRVPATANTAGWR